MKAPILLTQPDATRLLAGLGKQGYRCDHLPFMQTRLEKPDPVALKKQLLEAHHVVVASPVAAQWLSANFSRKPTWLPGHQRWFTPGSGTATLLQQWGVSAHYPQQQHNARAMLKVMAATIPSTACRVLWISSRAPVQGILAPLSGARLVHRPSHTASPLQYNCTQLQAYARHCWFISSKAVLEHAHRLCTNCSLSPLLLVSSPSLGGTAGSMGYTHLTANSTAIEHLLTALSKD